MSTRDATVNAWLRKNIRHRINVAAVIWPLAARPPYPRTTATPTGTRRFAKTQTNQLAVRGAYLCLTNV
jgi:hypothetical protein